jgi:hypothetical protein
VLKVENGAGSGPPGSAGYAAAGRHDERELTVIPREWTAPFRGCLDHIPAAGTIRGLSTTFTVSAACEGQTPEVLRMDVPVALTMDTAGLAAGNLWKSVAIASISGGARYEPLAASEGYFTPDNVVWAVHRFQLACPLPTGRPVTVEWTLSAAACGLARPRLA